MERPQGCKKSGLDTYRNPFEKRPRALFASRCPYRRLNQCANQGAKFAKVGRYVKPSWRNGNAATRLAKSALPLRAQKAAFPGIFGMFPKSPITAVAARRGQVKRLRSNGNASGTRAMRIDAHVAR
jgi:hypothetical protein